MIGLRVCGVGGELEADRATEHLRERLDMPVRRPELQFGVTGRLESQQVVLSAVVHLYARDGLRVAPVEPFGQPEERAQEADRPAVPRRAIGEPLV